MSTITLEEALKRARLGQLTGVKRIHPGVDTDNGDGPIPMPEVSFEHEGGDWEDVAFCYVPTHAALLAHCFNLFPEMVEALRGMLTHHHKHGRPPTSSTRTAERVLKLAETVNITGP